MTKKDITPVEIAEARARRERNRIIAGIAIWAIWLAVFMVGTTIHSGLVMGFAFALSMANIVVINGLHEKALRKIAGRPQVDYRKLRKLERRLPKPKGKAEGP